MYFSIKTCVLLYLETILYSDKRNYIDFLDSNFTVTINFNYYLHLLLFASGWLCFVMCYSCISLCVYCKLCVFACISTCTLGILKTYLK